MGVGLRLRLLPFELAVCTLPADAPLPTWVTAAAFYTLSRTGTELSIVCPVTCVPADVTAEMPWYAFEVAGPLDFALTGILAALANPLATAGIPIFAISTYHTDYVLVPAAQREAATDVLRQDGHTVS